MKIDLHCHTKKTVTGDPVTRNVSTTLFNKVIEKSNVRIVGITNHNEFDYEQFKLLSNSAKEICNIWPGIELTVKVSDDKGHILIISNPDFAEDFSQKVDELLGETKPDDVLLDMETLKNVFNPEETFYVAHYMGKDCELKETDIKKLKEVLADEDILFLEPSNVTSLGILLNHNYQSIMGSDVKDWNNYPANRIPNLRFDISDFRTFRLLAKKDRVIINSLLTQNGLIEVNVEKYWKKEITIYKDINIIFGGKGTGKSELLLEIKSSLLRKGNFKVNYFSTEDSSKKFTNIIKPIQTGTELQHFTNDDQSNEIEKINIWVTNNPTKLSDYVLWKESKSAEELQNIFCFINMTIDNIPDEKNFDDSVIEYHKISKIIDDFEKMNIQNYNIDTEIKLVGQTLESIKNSIEEKVKDLFIEYYSDFMLNKTISIMKNEIQKKKNIITKPDNTGLSETFLNLVKLENNITGLYNLLDLKSILSFEKIGEINNKGTVLKKSMLVINPDIESGVKYFGNMKTQKISLFKKNIKDVMLNIYNSKLYTNLKTLKEQISTENIVGLRDFVGRKNIITLEDKITEYKPSKGEEAMLVLNSEILADYDILLLDEPELSLGNEYVNNIILPQIKNLTSNGKIFVIVTHNSNLGVRMLPYQTIYMTYNNIEKKYKVYEGNAFSNELHNIENRNYKLNWSEEAIKTLEGGIDAFIERRNIYGRK